MTDNSKPSKIMLVAGEPSGDLHGASLVRELIKKNPRIQCFGMGGDGMADAGVKLYRHVREMAFMGLWEVAKHLPKIRRVFRQMTQLMDRQRPDVLVLIDYPGFNLQLAARAKKRRIPVLYYISPQIWAWGAGRLKKIRRVVDEMIVIFPFEETLYRKNGVSAHFVGHPLKDQVRCQESAESFFQRHGMNPREMTLALLPGSREHEVVRLLPPMIDAYHRLKEEWPGLQALVGKAGNLHDDLFLQHTRDISDVKIIEGETHGIMAHSDFALVASGTATLETAILGTPMVILYQISPLSYFVGRRLVRISHIGLVNIVAEKEIVPELLQGEAQGETVARVVLNLIRNETRMKNMRQDLKRVSDQLGPPGASRRAAEILMNMLAEGGAQRINVPQGETGDLRDGRLV